MSVPASGFTKLMLSAAESRPKEAILSIQVQGATFEVGSVPIDSLRRVDYKLKIEADANDENGSPIAVRRDATLVAETGETKAISIPAYQGYTGRSRVTEGLTPN